jgi:H-type lectin domain
MKIQHGKHLKNKDEITITFPTPFKTVPNVVITSHWANEHAGVGHAETIDQISTQSFSVASGNEAPNYFVEWIAVAPE